MTRKTFAAPRGGGTATKAKETHHQQIDMDGRRQFGLGQRGQLEPSRHSRRDSDVTLASGVGRSV